MDPEPRQGTEAPVFGALDHVMIQLDEPVSLFSVLHERPGLTIAVDMISYPFYRSALVTLGEVNLECIYQAGQPAMSSLPGSPRARFYGLAYEPADSLELARAELRAASIAHSPPLVFRGRVPPRFRPFCSNPGTNAALLHTNVEVGGLVNDRSILLAGLSNVADGKLHEAAGRGLSWLLQREPVVESFARAGDASGIFAEPIVQVVAYHHDVTARRAENVRALRESAGGVLGITGLVKVVLALRNVEAEIPGWRRVMGSANSLIEIVAGERNEIKTLVLGVRSIERAREHLKALEMIGEDAFDEVRIRPDSLFDLDVRLRERQKCRRESDLRTDLAMER